MDELTGEIRFHDDQGKPLEVPSETVQMGLTGGPIEALRWPEILSPDNTPAQGEIVIRQGSPRLMVTCHHDPLIALTCEGRIEKESREGRTSFEFFARQGRSSSFPIRFSLQGNPQRTEQTKLRLEVFQERVWWRRLVLSAYGVVALLVLVFLTTTLSRPLNDWIGQYVSVRLGKYVISGGLVALVVLSLWKVSPWFGFLKALRIMRTWKLQGHCEVRVKIAPQGAILHQRQERCAKLYREALVGRLSSLRILEMSEPVQLERVFVPLKMHQDDALGGSSEENEKVLQQLASYKRHAQWELQSRRSRESRAVTPEEAISQHSKVIILGDPGNGKTTVLRHLAVQLARRTQEPLPDLPIYIELHNFVHDGYAVANSSMAFADYFVRREGFDEHTFPEAARYFDARLREGSAVLLLDGLDEVSGKNEHARRENQRKVHAAIEQAVQRYEKSPIVLTCRIASRNSYINLPSKFYRFRLLNFDLSAILRFVENWFHHQNAETGEQLKREITNNPHLHGLLANPLLLALAALVYQRRRSLPMRRLELYKRCVDVLMAEWDAARNRNRYPSFALEHKEDLLKHIAWHFHKQGLRYFRKEELTKVIAQFLPLIELDPADASGILEEIHQQHGLLKQQNDDELYGFLHVSLQEYFAAAHITHWQRERKAIENRLLPWWREVICLYAGRGECTDLLRRILNSREDFFQSNLFLASRCLEENSPVAPWLRERIVNEIKRVLEESAHPQKQAVAIYALAGMRTRQVSTYLMKQWQANSRLREMILSALRFSREGAVCGEILLGLLEVEKNDEFRREIANALYKVAEGNAVKVLVRLLEKEEDLIVRESIAKTLGKLGEGRLAASVLLQIFTESKDRGLMYDVAVYLAEWGGENKDDLIRLLGEARDPEETLLLGWVLGRLGEKKLAIDTLLKILAKNQTVEMREFAAWAIGDLSERRIARRLLELVEKETDSGVRKEMAVALIKLGEETGGANILLELLETVQDRELRRAAVRLLDGLRSDDVKIRLESMFGSDPDPIVRFTSMRPRSKDQATIAAEAMQLVYDEQDSAVPMFALGFLGGLGERSVVEDLFKILEHDGSGKMRDTVAYTLIHLIEETDEKFLATAASVLARDKSNDGIYNLVAALSRVTMTPVYPEDIGVLAIEYPWAKDEPDPS